MADHIFELTANWQGDFKGSGHFKAGGLEYDVSIPVPFGGVGTGTNPEELLLASAANCYMIMLNIALQMQKVAFAEIKMHSKAVFGLNGGALNFTSLTHSPVVIVATDTSQEDIDKIHAAFKKADQSCMVSNLIHDKVTIAIEGKVEKA